ncbi:MAG: ethanolamine utilization protein EutN [Chloroflexi bacterium RBG_16_57_9]|nr:MAG: ethanolamine utilization protein EutN [Chloroflexi bacterium RBG_16_57_9]
MLICRVVGSVVSTVKDEKLSGTKLLVVREATVDNQLVGKPLVAVDSVGAGEGELVLIAQGSSARQTRLTKETPVDAVIMAIVDSMEVDGKVTFRKE